MPQLLNGMLLHQDVVSYADELRNRVTKLVGDVLTIVDQMYLEFSQFSLNQAALDQLVRNSQTAAFEAFSPTV